MFARPLASLGLAAALAAPLAAQAGPADSPIPRLRGETRAKHLYTITGIRASTSADLDYEVVVTCTSLVRNGGPSIVVGVEFFSFDGAPTPAGALEIPTAPENDSVASIPPGATIAIASGPIADIAEIYPDDNPQGLQLFQGSARVLSTSSKLICAAFQVDSGGIPPAHAFSLPMIKKTKQRGE